MNKYGFFRVATVTPDVVVADPRCNARTIVAVARDAAVAGARLVVFPEMSIPAYTCGDLFHSARLLDECMQALGEIVKESAAIDAALVVGLPMRVGTALYNVATVIAGGAVQAVIPKSYIPNYNEFYEKRWWVSGAGQPIRDIGINGCQVPFGVCQMVVVDGVKIAVEICEDLWSPAPPSTFATMAGAEVVCNLSASDTLVGKADYVRGLVAQQSARCLCGYVYASGANGESTTDLVFKPLRIVTECGTVLATGDATTMTVCDIDIEAIRRDRVHITSFADCAAQNQVGEFRITEIALSDSYGDKDTLLRRVDPHPFVPKEHDTLNERCTEIIDIQSRGLQQRLCATSCRHLVVGISGGLDSTLALLVAVHAFDALGFDRKGIVGVTMPGFGTTDRTHNNAVALMDALGVSRREISIVPAVMQHFKDIGHNAVNHDVTYENAQARQRTYLLMDIANQVGGMVLGTGDMSELALGWATYNGDHMSMYGVNVGVPKTLVRHLVGWFAHNDESLSSLLADIIDTPISPELLPAQEDGTIRQVTEDLVGPYELHDFFLYYTLRYGFDADKILYLARTAFTGVYDDEVIRKWLQTFIRRFFNQQFKRSCLPDGPKVGSVCLSPRGDWRMPSDASCASFGLTE